MTFNNKTVEIYDPVSFIKENIYEILPQNSNVQNISFSGFVKKAFHSNKRPKGVITVTYNDKISEKKLQLFIKQHSNALKVFNQMSYIYSSFSSLNSKAHIPKPLLCDDKNNVNYMEFIPGSPLTYVALINLLTFRRDQLTKMFYKIGQWLKIYHTTSKLEKTTTLDKIKEDVHTKLQTTPFFTETEKEKLTNRLKKTDLEDSYLILVKPHNDFALRNIITTKSNDFSVIDWDAMYHEKFTTETPVWNDITSFITSIQSLQRFSPLIASRQLNVLVDSFLQGYFENIKNAPTKKEINNILFIFTLCYFIGLIGDRPLPEIYKEKFGYRYISKLKKNLLQEHIL